MGILKDILAAGMPICFGISWPFSIIKSWKSRTAAGKSPIFLSFLIIGYICGISATVIGGTFGWIQYLYIADLLMVSTDFALYFRNRRLDRARQAERNEQ